MSVDPDDWSSNSTLRVRPEMSAARLFRIVAYAGRWSARWPLSACLKHSVDREAKAPMPAR
jgi:hypothetical protein